MLGKKKAPTGTNQSMSWPRLKVLEELNICQLFLNTYDLGCFHAKSFHPPPPHTHKHYIYIHWVGTTATKIILHSEMNPTAFSSHYLLQSGRTDEQGKKTDVHSEKFCNFLTKKINCD